MLVGLAVFLAGVAGACSSRDATAPVATTALANNLSIPQLSMECFDRHGIAYTRESDSSYLVARSAAVTACEEAALVKVKGEAPKDFDATAAAATTAAKFEDYKACLVAAGLSPIDRSTGEQPNTLQFGNDDSTRADFAKIKADCFKKTMA